MLKIKRRCGQRRNDEDIDKKRIKKDANNRRRTDLDNDLDQSKIEKGNLSK